MKISPTYYYIVGAVALGGLAAFVYFPGAEDVAAPTQAQVAFAEDATPPDSQLAEIYDRSCRACHAVNTSAAPLTGHGAAWQARLRGREIDDLVAVAKTGVNTMPAMGLCTDCSDDELKMLIEFMTRESQ